MVAASLQCQAERATVDGNKWQLKKDWLLYKYLNKQKGRWVFRINYPTQSKYEI